jgi:L-arabinokinase
VARRSALTAAAARAALDLDDSRPVVLVCFGGEGLVGLTPPDATLAGRLRFVVSDPMPPVGPQATVVRDADLRARGLRFPDLVRAADVVITKPGYGTAGECAVNEAAVVYTDRGPFREQAAIVAYLRRVTPVAELARADLLAGRWGDTVDRLLDQRPYTFPEAATDGATHVARRLADLVWPAAAAAAAT